ncbi:cell wall hydrolase [Sphingomonas sanxanigenens DSM 19645 = NX02]|uniref:N-acetylmuramoyl-L-alanine amidase n=1 Tax=Sphingomonas sanxanigenens DSM 19645 = NX02 TaxID=1123269 RepID=W0A1C8_9SPHN|nr:cell wall hydrolase [Sphingomonas sanxanigenens DSM 19645 = NX02]
MSALAGVTRLHAALLAAATIVVLFAAMTRAEAATITSIVVDGGQIRVTFDDSVTTARTLVLDGPRRIALDVQGATPGKAGRAGGPVDRIRQGLYRPDTARIVFDLARPVIVSDLSFSDGGRQLTLSIDRVDDKRFARAVGAAPKRYAGTGAARTLTAARSSGSVTVPLGPVRRLPGLPRVLGPAGRPLVVIDAGHGGHDPGSLGAGGKREKDATLAIATAIRDELVRSGRVRVALTRDTDRFLILEERYGIARRLKADLFISIHADSAPRAEAHGATVYTLSEVASDREAARLAQRENRSDIINGINLAGENSDVSSILLDLTQRETMNVSSDFARLLHREAGGFVPFRTDYHRFAGFVVLKAPDVPSVLFETGFMSNADDIDFLFSRAGRKRIATGVARAVQIQFARRIAGQ